jgi:hypothetical protein
MHLELSHICFSTYHIDLKTQIGLDATESKKDVRLCLYLCIVTYVDSRQG